MFSRPLRRLHQVVLVLLFFLVMVRPAESQGIIGSKEDSGSTKMLAKMDDDYDGINARKRDRLNVKRLLPWALWEKYKYANETELGSHLWNFHKRNDDLPWPMHKLLTRSDLPWSIIKMKTRRELPWPMHKMQTRSDFPWSIIKMKNIGDLPWQMHKTQTRSDLPWPMHKMQTRNDLPWPMHKTQTKSDLPWPMHKMQIRRELPWQMHKTQTKSDLPWPMHKVQTRNDLPWQMHKTQTKSDLPWPMHKVQTRNDLPWPMHKTQTKSDLPWPMHKIRTRRDLPWPIFKMQTTRDIPLYRMQTEHDTPRTKKKMHLLRGWRGGDFPWYFLHHKGRDTPFLYLPEGRRDFPLPWYVKNGDVPLGLLIKKPDVKYRPDAPPTGMQEEEEEIRKHDKHVKGNVENKRSLLTPREKINEYSKQKDGRRNGMLPYLWLKERTEGIKDINIKEQ